MTIDVRHWTSLSDEEEWSLSYYLVRIPRLELRIGLLPRWNLQSPEVQKTDLGIQRDQCN